MRELPNYVEYPVLQVRPWGLLAYDRKEYFTGRRKDEGKKPRKENKKYTGQITEYSKKRLRRAIQLIVASSLPKEAPNFKTGKTYKFKVNFITLTLPATQGNHTDKDIKSKVLDPFIKRMKRKHKLNSYVWRAEKQLNQNLHFHLITDTWIHYEKIRNDWNDCCQHLGLIDEFENKHGHRSPNSTDVHAVWKVKNLTQYFIKYMTKEEVAENYIAQPPHAKPKIISRKKMKKGKYMRILSKKEIVPIDGKIWDCSANLKVKKNCELLIEDDELKMWNDAMNDDSLKKKIDPLYTLIFLNEFEFKKMIKGRARTAWDNYLKEIREPMREVPTTQTRVA